MLAKKDTWNKKGFIEKHIFKCCILTFVPAKHVIPKTVEVHIPLAWVSLADKMGQGKIPWYSQTDAPEDSDLWTAWQLFPLDDNQTCQGQRKWHVPMAFMGRYWVDDWTIYNSVKTGSQ